MMDIEDIDLKLSLSLSTQKILDERKHKIYVRTDNLFAGLLMVEWVAAILTALVISPLAWNGNLSNLHIHVIFASVVGGALALFPLSLVATRAGAPITRHVIAASQMLFSAMFVHLSGGRIETHFHVFGSLALLAFYRDWGVIVTASSVTAMDHLVRSIFWPQSVFGIAYAAPARAFEHIGWVLFEDIGLLKGISQSIREMHENAAQTAMLEQTNEIIENAVMEQTKTIREGEIELHRLAAIVQQSDDAIISMSLDGTIRSWNDGATRLYQYAADEMVGHLYNPPLPEGLMNEHRDLLRKIKKGQNISNFETSTYKKDGTLVDVSLSMSPVRGANDVICAFAVVARDITQKKIAERRISEFYSVISHELRTPLTSIRGALALIADGIVEQGTAESTELIGIAQNSTSRLVRLINDILDLRKIEAGKFELNLTDVSAQELMDASVSSMLGFADEKKVHLNSSVPENFFVEADADRINQVLSNLISNAVKYAPENSTVEIQAVKLIHSMRFTVSDRGPGIPLEFQSKLFGKFQQVDASDTRAKEGSGLGLAISKAIIEQHGGTISFTSSPNIETTFQFDIPLTSKHISASDARPALEQSPESQAETYQDAKPLRLVPIKPQSNATGSDVAGMESFSPATSSSTSSDAVNTPAPVSSSPVNALTAAARAAGSSLHGFVSAVGMAQTEPPEFELDATSDDTVKRLNRACNIASTETDGVPSHIFPAFTNEEMSISRRRWPAQLSGIDQSDASKPSILDKIEIATASGRANKILIVEDDAELAALLRINLMRQNYICLTAQTLEEARAIIDREMPDAVVLDLELPDGDGLDLLSQLPGAGKPSGRTPVIVITGSDRNATKEELSIVDWLQKPFNQGNLSDAVRKAVTFGERRKKVMVIDDDPETKLAVTEQLSQLEINFVDADDCVDIARYDDGPQLDLIVFKESCLQGSEATRAFRKLRGKWSDYVPIIIYSSSELSGLGQSTSSVSISHHMPRPTLEARFLAKVENVLFNFLSQSKSLLLVDSGAVEPVAAVKAFREIANIKKVEEL